MKKADSVKNKREERYRAQRLIVNIALYENCIAWRLK